MVLLLSNMALSCLKIFFKHELTELCMYNACASRPSSLIMNLFLFASLHILLLSCLSTMHTVSFDWFLPGLEWILNLEFCLLKLLTFYQKLLWNIRSRLNSSILWVFRPVFIYVWSKLKLCAQKIKVFINHI